MMIDSRCVRHSPSFGNFGHDSKRVVQLPGCLKTMLEESVLPRARREQSAVFRQTVMTEQAVIEVLNEYGPRMRAWYHKMTTDEHKTSASSTDMLQMDQLLRECDRIDFVGNWECMRESDVSGDPRCRTKYEWSLSIAQARTARTDRFGHACCRLCPLSHGAHVECRYAEPSWIRSQRTSSAREGHLTMHRSTARRVLRCLMYICQRPNANLDQYPMSSNHVSSRSSATV